MKDEYVFIYESNQMMCSFKGKRKKEKEKNGFFWLPFNWGEKSGGKKKMYPQNNLFPR